MPASGVAVDELCDDYRISDVTWEALAEQYDDRQLVEVPDIKAWRAASVRLRDEGQLGPVG